MALSQTISGRWNRFQGGVVPELAEAAGPAPPAARAPAVPFRNQPVLLSVCRWAGPGVAVGESPGGCFPIPGVPPVIIFTLP